jgi:S1-C subfamily serine protease
MLVQNGTFGEPPHGWAILDETRTSIERTIPSVGRIEIHGHPEIGAWGTGWVVGENLVMTNRHVINGLNDIADFIFTLGTPHIDYLEEDGNPARAEFRIKSAVVHDTLDLALVRVEKLDTSPLEPPPLRISGTPPTANINVYAVGYPVSPGETPPQVLAAIFGNKFGVKRLQPGLLTVIHDGVPKIEHDASTLGGSSGSPVIDLERDVVVGLHFSGKYKKRNNAVALWKLTDDQLLKDHGIQFH